MNKQSKVLLALVAAGLAGGTASTASAQTVINISGATLFESFFQASASTNDYWDVDGDGFARKLLSDDQLALSTLPPPSGLGQNLGWWSVQYRGVGSVNGIQDLIDFGQTFATAPGSISSSTAVLGNGFYNRVSYHNTSGNTGPADPLNPGAFPVRSNFSTLQASYLSHNDAIEGIRIDLSVADVPTTWGVRGGVGTAVYNAKPTVAGYGRNPKLAVSKTGANTTTDNLLANLGTLNLNTGLPNSSTVFDTPVAAVPICPITNLGTGKQTTTFTEMRHLFITGRSNTGENFMVVTRDSGSGTRNGFISSLGVDPSWGMGDNVGDASSSSAQALLGANFIPSNKASSGALESTVANHRLAISYTGAERGKANSWLTGGRIEILAAQEDVNGGTDYVRPYIDRVLDNGLKGQIDPSTGLAYTKDGFRMGGIESFGSIGDPKAASVAKGGFANGNPGLRNVEAAAYINNITRSITAFDAAPGSNSTLFTPGELLGTSFILVAATDQSQSLTDPSAWSNNPLRNQFVQDFVRPLNVLSDPGYQTFGTYTLNGKVPARTTGVTYTDGIVNGANYINQAAVPVNVTYGANLTSRNRVSGDFDGNGLRNANDAVEMIKAWRQRNGGPVWVPAAGTGAIAGAPGTDAVIEILGDFNGDGNFNAADLRYWADGLATDATTGLLNRFDGFSRVDSAFGGNLFGTTLATGVAYTTGASAGDIAGAAGSTPGWAPTGSDGVINAKDIDAVYKQFKQNPNVTDGALNWSNLNEAIGGDLSADINGDLVIDQKDVCKLVIDILGTTFGDVNLDGVVNAADRAIAVANQGLAGGWAQGDMDGNGTVDARDLQIIDGTFNPCCPADFDGDTFLTGDDFDAYVAAFELGDISTDFDGDGFVTGDDFDAFVRAFEAGC